MPASLCLSSWLRWSVASSFEFLPWLHKPKKLTLKASFSQLFYHSNSEETRTPLYKQYRTIPSLRDEPRRSLKPIQPVFFGGKKTRKGAKKDEGGRKIIWYEQSKMEPARWYWLLNEGWKELQGKENNGWKCTVWKVAGLTAGLSLRHLWNMFLVSRGLFYSRELRNRQCSPPKDSPSCVQILVQFVGESPEMAPPMLLTILHSFKVLVVNVGPIPVRLFSSVLHPMCHLKHAWKFGFLLDKPYAGLFQRSIFWL